ncbi:hypothetical protein MBLNU13_g02133t1 [Cladosporium sp. NU13]
MVDIKWRPYLQWNVLNTRISIAAKKMADSTVDNPRPAKRAKLDRDAEMKKVFGDQIDPEETFEVLVYDQLNRNPMLAGSYIPPREQKKLYRLNRNKYCHRSSFFREELEKADARSSDPNKPRRVRFENHLPDDFEAYLRYVDSGWPNLAADDKDPLFPLLRLYVLADQLFDFTIANFIMNDIIRASDEFDHTPSKKEIWFVWEMIEEYAHPLKTLFVDY